MSYLEIIDRVLEKQRREKPTPQRDISLLRLSELAKRNMAIKIYSEILGCEIWLCSNELMALQIKEDSPEVVTYTADEMIEIIKLNPTPEDIKHIHNAKGVFNGSRLAGATQKMSYEKNELNEIRSDETHIPEFLK